MDSEKRTLQQLMFSLIEIWKQGNQSQKDFCQEKSLTLSKFQYWYKKHQQSHSGPGGEPFTVVTVRNNATVPKPVASGSMEIIWPDGRRLIFHQGVEASFLRTLLG